MLITDQESGEIVCSSCGQVVSDTIQQSLEGVTTSGSSKLGNDNNNRAVGMPISVARHDMGLATLIGKADKDASGRRLDAAMRTTMERLRAWDYRTQIHTPTDRNLKTAFSQLDKLKDKLALPNSAIEKAAYIYRKAQERGMVRGRTIRSVLAATSYIVCREMGISRTLKDIAMAADVRPKDLSRTYRLLVFELDLKVPIIDPMKAIARIANKAELRETTKRQAINIMYEVTKRELSAGKDPMGLAASVLYLASHMTRDYTTQIDIAEAAAVTEVTLRNRSRDLRDKLKLLN
ncbi:MAG: transcription initiation factor IIB [Nitrososphaeraceae archaeon]|nr:transcription initiation factor IIB [Nitrososphaeraceae archaeon]MBV9666740.1 transcription initiation factor IIB [Nitrososphaeraceae archaeon]